MFESLKKIFGRRSLNYLIVGLGNPGPEYHRTRHNLGFTVVESFARENDIAMRQMRYEGLYGEGKTCGAIVGVLKPATFMNLSGRSVDRAVSDLDITPDRLIVVHDDLDLYEGAVRLKMGGGPGGHRGLKSIIETLDDEAFLRLRLGIGRPPGQQEAADFVLDKLGERQWDKLFINLIEDAESALDTILEDGLERAMNQVNQT